MKKLKSILLSFAFLLAPLSNLGASTIEANPVPATVVIRSSVNQMEMVRDGNVFKTNHVRIQGHIISDVKIVTENMQKAKLKWRNNQEISTLHQKRKLTERYTTIGKHKTNTLEDRWIDKAVESPIKYFVIGLPKTLKPGTIIKGFFVKHGKTTMIVEPNRMTPVELITYKFVSAVPEIITLRKLPEN